MISRLETMVLMGMTLPLKAIRRQIASGINIMIHLTRMPDKRRVVSEISEVIGFIQDEVQLRTLFQWEDTKGDLVQVNELYHSQKLERTRAYEN